MSQVIHYPHVVDAPGESPRLHDWPRIRVSQIVMDHLGHAWSPDEIARQYPHLSLAEIHSALAYYYDNRAEIDREIKAELCQANIDADAARSTPLAVRLARLAR